MKWLVLIVFILLNQWIAWETFHLWWINLLNLVAWAIVFNLTAGRD